MAIGNAIKVLRWAIMDAEFRNEMESFNTSEKLHQYLAFNQLDFTDAELEESINFMHVQCQTIEQAGELLHISMWLKMLFAFQAR